MRGILARQMARMQLPLDVRESLQAAVGTLHAVFAHLTTYFKPVLHHSRSTCSAFTISIRQLISVKFIALQYICMYFQ